MICMIIGVYLKVSAYDDFNHLALMALFLTL